MIVPLPQSIVMGVVAVVLLPLHVKLISYPFVLAVGAAHVMTLHVAFISEVFTELHDCPVTMPHN